MQENQILQKFFKAAVEQTADSVFITDRNGIIQYVNPAFEEMTGFKSEEALGHTPRIIKSGLQSLKHYKKLWSTILSGKTFRTNVVNRRKDGKLFYADHTITPIKDKSGKVTHFVGIWKDITKQVELNKRKDEFMAMASHELKTPVTTIKGYTEFLQKKLTERNDEKNLYFVSQINRQTDKIIGLINDFFDVSKIEAGKLILQKEKVNLGKLVTKAVRDFQNTPNHHKIIKQRQIQVFVNADADRIEQVLMNLLTNAVKFSPRESKIIVDVKCNQKCAIVSVKDFGIGIPKPEIKKIFDRFYQVDEQGQRGFGLGLYISAEIIKRHKGKIGVESEPGKGSTFFFTLLLDNR